MNTLQFAVVLLLTDAARELKECGTFFGTPLIWEGSVEQAPPYPFRRAVSELAEEAEVVFAESADVGDVAGAHGESFDAEAEGPAGHCDATSYRCLSTKAFGRRTRTPARPDAVRRCLSPLTMTRVLAASAQLMGLMGTVNGDSHLFSFDVTRLNRWLSPFIILAAGAVRRWGRPFRSGTSRPLCRPWAFLRPLSCSRTTCTPQ